MCKAAFEALKKTRGSIINISATLPFYTIDLQLHASAAKVSYITLFPNYQMI
jgi:hypothetical protein